MIYKIIRPIVRFAMKLYFRKIYIDGLENIPSDKPVILVSNHPSAFIEPCLLACFLPLNLHFLVRGDLFSKKWLSWLLVGTNQIPIFRYKDGLKNVKKNLITQDAVRNLFEQKKCLLMFPEGHTHENLFLTPLKKGLSRFAFMDDNADVLILPVGVNFDKNVLFNSKVSVNVGEALDVKMFKNQGFETEAKMHKALLLEVHDRMKKCIRHLENKDREELTYNAYAEMDLHRSESILPVIENQNSVFLEEKNMADRIDTDDSYMESMNQFFQNYKNAKINVPSAIDLFFMMFLFPLFLLGICIHGIPVALARTFVDKRISDHEFKSPVFFALVVVQYILFTLTFIVLSLIFGWKVILAYILAIFIGIFTIYYSRAFAQKWRYIFSSKEKRKIFLQKSGEWKLTLTN